MKYSEKLDRFSLVLVGLAIGFFLGGLVQVLGLPSWIQVFGMLIIVAISFIISLRSISVMETEIATDHMAAVKAVSTLNEEK